MEENNIKVYLVYIVGPFEDESFHEDVASSNECNETYDYDDPTFFLYGYTTDKRLLKEFLKYRKTSRFYIKTVEMTKTQFDTFEGYHRDHTIHETYIEAPISFIKYPPNDVKDGVCLIDIPLTAMEDTEVSTSCEWFDEILMSKLPEEMLKTISIFFKCTTDEVKAAMYRSGVYGIIQYMTFLYKGTTFAEDTMQPMLNEPLILLEYSGETFDFDKIIKRMEKEK